MIKDVTSTTEKISKLKITGNIIPHNWYSTMLYLTPKGKKKPHLTAMIILSDIIYWHTNTEKRNETTGMIESIRKKFKSDKLQKSYQDYANLLSLDKEVIKDAFKFLVFTRVICLEFRTILVGGVPHSNVMFIDINVENLIKYSFPTPMEFLTPRGKIQYPYRVNNLYRLGKLTHTYTENTTESTTENTDLSLLDIIKLKKENLKISKSFKSICFSNKINNLFLIEKLPSEDKWQEMVMKYSEEYLTEKLLQIEQWSKSNFKKFKSKKDLSRMIGAWAKKNNDFDNWSNDNLISEFENSGYQIVNDFFRNEINKGVSIKEDYPKTKGYIRNIKKLMDQIRQSVANYKDVEVSEIKEDVVLSQLKNFLERLPEKHRVNFNVNFISSGYKLIRQEIIAKNEPKPQINERTGRVWADKEGI